MIWYPHFFWNITKDKGKRKLGRWKEQAWCLLLLRVVVHVCFTTPCVPDQTHNISQRTKKQTHTLPLLTSLWKTKKSGCLVHLVWKVWRISGAENKQHLVFSAKPICGRFFPHSWQQIVSRLVFNLDSFLTDCTRVLPSAIVLEVPQPKLVIPEYTCVLLSQRIMGLIESDWNVI